MLNVNQAGVITVVRALERSQVDLPLRGRNANQFATNIEMVASSWERRLFRGMWERKNKTTLSI